KMFERLTGGGPSADELMTQQNLGFFLSRVGFGRDPQASHVELVREMIAACPKAASKEAVTALIGLDMTEELTEIRVPTLVLSGSADVIAPPAQSRRIAELIPDARLEVFKGAGHMLMLERTDEVDALISEFARDLGAGVLAGGSAFGLAAADCWMRSLEAQGRGFSTAGGKVPIVPAAAVYDLVSSCGVRPGPDEGVAALAAAEPGGCFATGQVGAGT